MVSIEDSQLPRAVFNLFFHSLLARLVKSGDDLRQHIIISKACQEVKREIEGEKGGERKRLSHQERERMREREQECRQSE